MARRGFAWFVSAMVPIALAVAPVAASGDKVKGEQVYKEAKCSVCHKISSAGGKMGPDLTKVGTTRDLAWLAKYLANPKAENPKNKMPPVKAKGAEMDDLIAYLLSLK
jgi:cytochrome c2